MAQQTRFRLPASKNVFFQDGRLFSGGKEYTISTADFEANEFPPRTRIWDDANEEWRTLSAADKELYPTGMDVPTLGDAVASDKPVKQEVKAKKEPTPTPEPTPEPEEVKADDGQTDLATNLEGDVIGWKKVHKDGKFNGYIIDPENGNTKKVATNQNGDNIDELVMNAVKDAYPELTFE